MVFNLLVVNAQVLGGGWRQGGILAVAAEWALDRAKSTTKEDHRRANMLAAGIDSVIPTK